VGMHHHLDAIGVVGSADLGVTNGMPVARFRSNQAGETVATALGEIKPVMIRQRPLPIGGQSSVEDFHDGGHVGIGGCTDDFDMSSA
jgi:hypothetical protein